MVNKYLKNSTISFTLIISIVLSPLAFLPRKVEAQVSGYISGIAPAITQLPLCKDKLQIKNLFKGGGLQSGPGDYGLGLGNTNAGIGNKGQAGMGLSDYTNDSLYGESSIDVSLPPYITQKITDGANASIESQKKLSSLEANDTCLKSIGRMMIKMLLQKITLSTVEWINNGYDGSPLFIQDSKTFFGDIAKNEILQFGIEIGNPELFPFGKAWMQNQALAFQNKFADNARYSLNELIKNTNPNYSAQTFSLDFSQGGWDAWEYMTQVPANNAIGFNLMASNELGRRLEGTFQSTANTVRDNLREAGGYLGTERCVEPSGVTKEEHERALRSQSVSSGARECTEGWEQDPNNAANWICFYPKGVTMEEHEIAIKEKGSSGGDRVCNRWEYVTPGKMVADAATKLVNYPDNNLLKAEDLNDAVAAILDAVLNNFATDLMSESGFAGLGSSQTMKRGADGTFVYSPNQPNTNWTEKDFPGSLIAGSSFLQKNPNFNIRTDLNQALIDEQRIFVDKLKEQNKQLMSKVPASGEYTGNYGLLPVIYQLDYCIPGPHPGYEYDSQEALNAALSAIVPETATSIVNQTMEQITGSIKQIATMAAVMGGAAIGASIGSAVPVVGTIIGAAVGAVVGILINKIGNNAEKRLKVYYATIYGLFTGVVADDTENNNPLTANLLSKQAVVQVVNEIFRRYIDLIQKVFKAENLPTVTIEAAQKFNLARGYKKIFTNTEERIVSMRSLIVRLEEIKKEIDILNEEFKDGVVRNREGVIAPESDIKDSFGSIVTLGQQGQYEENLKPWISAFGRLSAEMVNGDDIAIVDNMTKEIVDERDYIYKNLLKGPLGCEKDLELGRGSIAGAPSVHHRVFELKRAKYPEGLPILYDYNNWNAENRETKYFPDPFNSGYTTNRINQHPDIAVNRDGPGFLSMIIMAQKEACVAKEQNESGGPYGGPGWFLGCMTIDDLIPMGNGDFAPLGMVNPSYTGNDWNAPNYRRNGIFEEMIKVY